MADGFYQVGLTETAIQTYRQIVQRAEACRLLNAKDQEPILRLERTQAMLTELRKPQTIDRSQHMLGTLNNLLSLSESSTYVYYCRFPSVRSITVFQISESTTDPYVLLAQLVFSGDFGLLSALGINPPQMSSSQILLQ